MASNQAIVVATDSRRLGSAGAETDDTKKLFLLPDNRVVAIAGLVDASVHGFPEITAQIPPLLEVEIERSAHIDRFRWDDPPPPAEVDRLALLSPSDGSAHNMVLSTPRLA